MIGDLLRLFRNERGLSQTDLADKLACSSHNDSVGREHVSRWERGERIPNPYWRDWLSRVLEVPHDQLDHAALVSRRIRTLRQIEREHLVDRRRQ